MKNRGGGGGGGGGGGKGEEEEKQIGLRNFLLSPHLTVLTEVLFQRVVLLMYN